MTFFFVVLFILAAFIFGLGWILLNPSGPPHKADEYFRLKFRERLDAESFTIVREAQSIRHQYPDLSGPELVRLVYWGASGNKEDE